MATPPTVEIPGYAAAIAREDEVRRKAFAVASSDKIAGVRVRQMTLRDMLTLEQIRNGFFVPFTFETNMEVLTHCAQLVWWMSDCTKPPLDSSSTIHPRATIARVMLLKHLSRFPASLATETRQYLSDTFMDAPKSTGPVKTPAHASQPAYIMDLFASGGYTLTDDQILDMPLVRMWQLIRLINSRVHGSDLSNPSDAVACEHLAKLNGGNQP